MEAETASLHGPHKNMQIVVLKKKFCIQIPSKRARAIFLKLFLAIGALHDA
jgi:hypothetical protein